MADGMSTLEYEKATGWVVPVCGFIEEILFAL